MVTTNDDDERERQKQAMRTIRKTQKTTLAISEKAASLLIVRGALLKIGIKGRDGGEKRLACVGVYECGCTCVVTVVAGHVWEEGRTGRGASWLYAPTVLGTHYHPPSAEKRYAPPTIHSVAIQVQSGPRDGVPPGPAGDARAWEPTTSTQHEEADAAVPKSGGVQTAVRLASAAAGGTNGLDRSPSAAKRGPLGFPCCTRVVVAGEPMVKDGRWNSPAAAVAAWDVPRRPWGVLHGVVVVVVDGPRHWYRGDHDDNVGRGDCDCGADAGGDCWCEPFPHHDEGLDRPASCLPFGPAYEPA